MFIVKDTNFHLEKKKNLNFVQNEAAQANDGADAGSVAGSAGSSQDQGILNTMTSITKQRVKLNIKVDYNSNA